jgi:hypothetical protein
MFIIGYALPIITASTQTQIVGACTIQNFNSAPFSLTNTYQLRYTGIPTVNAKVNLRISYAGTAGGKQLQFAVYKNSTINANSEITGGTQLLFCQSQIDSAGIYTDYVEFYFSGIATTDYFTFTGANFTDVTDITVNVATLGVEILSAGTD